MRRLFAAALLLAGFAACAPKGPETFTGTIADASMNTLTVRSADRTVTFSTLDADRSRAYGLLLGAPVRVEYTGRLREGAAATCVETDRTYSEAVGRWTMRDPLDPEAVMGIEIEVEGRAASINMATLLYSSWELGAEPGRIVLRGRSLGNGEPIAFTQTGILARTPGGGYTLAIEGTDALYTKADE